MQVSIHWCPSDQEVRHSAVADQEGQCRMYHCTLYVNVMKGKERERGVRVGMDIKIELH